MGLCRLCLSIVFENNIASSEVLEALKTFMPELNLDIVEKSMICKECIQNINTTCSLLQLKRDSDMIIEEQLNKSSTSKINLKVFYEAEDISGVCSVCRLCLKLIKGRGTYLYETPRTKIPFKTINDMFQLCCIQLSLGVSYNPVMCSKCLKLLQISYVFKKNIIEIEKKIKHYYQYLNACIPLSSVELETIRQQSYGGSSYQIVYPSKKNDQVCKSEPDRFDEEACKSKPDVFAEEACKSEPDVFAEEACKNDPDMFDKGEVPPLEPKVEPVEGRPEMPSSKQIVVTNSFSKFKKISGDEILVARDHCYSCYSIVNKADIEKRKSENQNLVKIYLEVTRNETHFKEGYHEQIQKKWLKIYPNKWRPGEHLCNFATYLITKRIVTGVTLRKLRLEVEKSLIFSKVCYPAQILPNLIPKPTKSVPITKFVKPKLKKAVKMKLKTTNLSGSDSNIIFKKRKKVMLPKVTDSAISKTTSIIKEEHDYPCMKIELDDGEKDSVYSCILCSYSGVGKSLFVAHLSNSHSDFELAQTIIWKK